MVASRWLPVVPTGGDQRLDFGLGQVLTGTHGVVAGRRGVATFRISMVGGTIRRAGLVMIGKRSVA